jgi:hypothetical protein
MPQTLMYPRRPQQKEMQMSSFKFTEVPSNESVASLVTLAVAAWFLAAGAVMLAEPSVESQARALHAKIPVVTVRQVSAMQEEQPETRMTITVVAQRSLPGVS